MTVRHAASEKDRVILMRLGYPHRMFELPPGSTLSDLLKEADLSTHGFQIWIDGKRVEEAVILQPGTKVQLVPDGDATQTEPWRQTFGMFRDDPLFPQMVVKGRAIRDADREAP